MRCSGRPHGLVRPLALLALVACTGGTAPEPRLTLEPAGLLVQPPTDPLPAEGPVVLASAWSGRGYAVSRFALPQGEVVQVQHVCGEWGDYQESVLLSTRLGPSARVIPFQGGPATGRAGHLLVESHHPVGSTGSGELDVLPEGASAVVQGSNGARYVTRALAIEPERGQVLEAGWDTFGLLAAEQGHVLVIAHRAGPVEVPGGPDPVDELRSWNLDTGAEEPLGKAPPELRAAVVGEELRVALAEGGVAVSAGDGSTRPLSSQELGGLGSWPALPTPPDLSGATPQSWTTTDGRPVRVQRAEDRIEAPAVGMCSVPGLHRSGALLFTDGGVWWWPEGATADW